MVTRDALRRLWRDLPWQRCRRASLACIMRSLCISVFYLLLFGVLLLNILLPPDALLLSNPILRYMLASVLASTPVFLANIIFKHTFRDSETADIAFASNLL